MECEEGRREKEVRGNTEMDDRMGGAFTCRKLEGVREAKRYTGSSFLYLHVIDSDATGKVRLVNTSKKMALVTLLHLNLFSVLLFPVRLWDDHRWITKTSIKTLTTVC